MLDGKKRSDEWPKSHRTSEKKWKDIEEKVKAGEKFSDYKGFANLYVWASCGYCKEFGDRSDFFYLYFCLACPLNQRKTKQGRTWIPICNNRLDIPSVVSAFVIEMRKIDPDTKKALKLIRIIRDEIAKDKPQTVEVQLQQFEDKIRQPFTRGNSNAE